MPRDSPMPRAGAIAMAEPVAAHSLVPVAVPMPAVPSPKAKARARREERKEQVALLKHAKTLSDGTIGDALSIRWALQRQINAVQDGLKTKGGYVIPGLAKFKIHEKKAVRAGLVKQIAGKIVCCKGKPAKKEVKVFADHKVKKAVL